MGYVSVCVESACTDFEGPSKPAAAPVKAKTGTGKQPITIGML